MRDLLVTAIVVGSIPFILARPYVGILVWSWLGYMNPHRLGWGFAYDFPFAFWVAIATLLAWLLSNEPKRIPVTGLTVLWFLFVCWMGVTTLLAIYPEAAWGQYETVLKIQLMTFATVAIMVSRERLRMLVWIIVLSIGYFGVKGGVFTILYGGEHRVWGPPSSYIEGNNELALALLMILPLMQYLRTTAKHRSVRLGLLAAMILCAFAIVGSQSRGALVGGIAMAAFLWLKSRGKIITAAVMIFAIPALFAFMPAQWHERMQTIVHYEGDESAVSRLQTWEMTVNLANARPAGGGFELWSAEVFDRYSEDRKHPNDAHSIYFKVLAEHGWFGLALFMGIGIAAWRTGSTIIARCGADGELRWLSDLARMTQVSLAAFASGGAFLSLSYFDLYWHLVAILVIGGDLMRRQLAIANPSPRDGTGVPAMIEDPAQIATAAPVERERSGAR